MKWAGAAVLASLSDSVLMSPRCVSARFMLMLISSTFALLLMWGLWKDEFSVRRSQSGICVAMASRMMVKPEVKELANKAHHYGLFGVLVGRWWAVASLGGP